MSEESKFASNPLSKSDTAYDKFVSNPLMKILGVDRASFIAGYETAVDELERENAELREVLKPFALFACDEPCDCHNCRARALLAKQEVRP